MPHVVMHAVVVMVIKTGAACNDARGGVGGGGGGDGGDQDGVQHAIMHAVVVVATSTMLGDTAALLKRPAKPRHIKHQWRSDRVRLIIRMCTTHHHGAYVHAGRLRNH